MTHIVGLDLSLTSAGIAVLSTSPPAVREQGQCCPILLRAVGEAGKKTDTYAQRNRRIRTQTRAIRAHLDDLDIAYAAIEGPIYAGKLLPSYYDRAGLFHAIFALLDVRKIPIAVIPPTTGHQFVTGQAHPTMPDGTPDRKKLTVMWETQKWWPHGRRDELGLTPIPQVTNGDMGDALGLAVMTAMHLGLQLPFRPRARHYNAVATANWPK